MTSPQRGVVGERFRLYGRVLMMSFDRFDDLDGLRLGASFSYYATFAIFPLLLLTVTVIGYVVGDSAEVRQKILAAVGNADHSVTDTIRQTLTSMGDASARKTSAVVGLVSLLFSASGAFVELDFTLNKIWCVEPRVGKGLLGKVRVFFHERLSGFACVAGIGIFLILSLLVSSTMSYLSRHAGSFVAPFFWRFAELGVSVVLLSAALTAAFHFVPRSRPALRNVLGGAVLTTVLLTLLKALFAFYVSHLTSYSAYGVAGGVLALATWIYLSSQIIFFGATLTRVHGELTGPEHGGHDRREREDTTSPASDMQLRRS